MQALQKYADIDDEQFFPNAQTTDDDLEDPDYYPDDDDEEAGAFVHDSEGEDAEDQQPTPVKTCAFDQKKNLAIECAKKFVSKTLDDLVGQVNLLSQFQRRFFVQALLASCTASGRKCWTTSLTDMEPDSRTSPISTCFDFFLDVCVFL
jgi:hypothetical protein